VAGGRRRAALRANPWTSAAVSTASEDIAHAVSRNRGPDGWREGCSPNPDPSAARGTIRLVTLERPPRTPAGALTDRVRTAILRDAERAGITPAALLVLYARAEYLGTPSDIANEIEERYQLGRGALVKQMDHRADQWVDASRFTKDMWTDYVSRDDLKHRVLDEHAHEIMLLEFPEPEFLTAV